MLQDISPIPKTDEELERGVRNLIGFAQCLLAMKQEILRNESSHIDPSINQDARRGVELSGSKQSAL